MLGDFFFNHDPPWKRGSPLGMELSRWGGAQGRGDGVRVTFFLHPSPDLFCLLPRVAWLPGRGGDSSAVRQLQASPGLGAGVPRGGGGGLGTGPPSPLALPPLRSSNTAAAAAAALTVRPLPMGS